MIIVNYADLFYWNCAVIEMRLNFNDFRYFVIK